MKKSLIILFMFLVFCSLTAAYDTEDSIRLSVGTETWIEPNKDHDIGLAPFIELYTNFFGEWSPIDFYLKLQYDLLFADQTQKAVYIDTGMSFKGEVGPGVLSFAMTGTTLAGIGTEGEVEFYPADVKISEDYRLYDAAAFHLSYTIENMYFAIGLPLGSQTTYSNNGYVNADNTFLDFYATAAYRCDSGFGIRGTVNFAADRKGILDTPAEEGMYKTDIQLSYLHERFHAYVNVELPKDHAGDFFKDYNITPGIFFAATKKVHLWADIPVYHDNFAGDTYVGFRIGGKFNIYYDFVELLDNMFYGY